jgi:hypothetical protein
LFVSIYIKTAKIATNNVPTNWNIEAVKLFDELRALLSPFWLVPGAAVVTGALVGILVVVVALMVVAKVGAEVVLVVGAAVVVVVVGASVVVVVGGT